VRFEVKMCRVGMLNDKRIKWLLWLAVASCNSWLAVADAESRLCTVRCLVQPTNLGWCLTICRMLDLTMINETRQACNIWEEQMTRMLEVFCLVSWSPVCACTSTVDRSTGKKWLTTWDVRLSCSLNRLVNVLFRYDALLKVKLKVNVDLYSALSWTHL